MILDIMRKSVKSEILQIGKLLHTFLYMRLNGTSQVGQKKTFPVSKGRKGNISKLQSDPTNPPLLGPPKW